mmetsp:Transcript_55034/g.103124  ORF Transcript_55034/g.103124 Transcript_55034/m.103124 type:complete len:650 (-) Transcript_55034:179-2128(-)
MNRAAATAAVIGAVLVQVPFVYQPARAAWCWPAQPPICNLPTVANGACQDATNTTVTTMTPGATCNPVCDDGFVLIGSCSEILCPPSGPEPNCLDDAAAGTYWGPCDFGDTCLSPNGGITLGEANFPTYGYFSCVAAGSAEAAGECGAVIVATTPPAAEGLTDAEKLDYGTLGILGGLLFVAFVGMIVSFTASSALARCFFFPGPKQWSGANVLGILAVLVAIVAACLLPMAIRSTGIAAGIASLLTILWSFFKGGIHDMMGMTREAAWRIHSVVGALTLIVGVVHGSVVLYEKGSGVSANGFWIVGGVGAVLMILGVVAAPFVHYDKFKLLHFISMWGYIAAIVHMLDHAVVFQTIASITVAAANCAALLAFFVQKIYTKVSAGKITVQKAELVSENGGQHLFLTMSVPGFKFQAGQWGHLAVKAASPVPHPFTLIPGEFQNEVRIFMKINRSGFTSKMAKLCSPDAAPPAMALEGPYGRPSVPAPGMERTVFVLGGVGITPGLSLAKAAAETSGAKVPMFWALRSLELLHRSAPLLEPHLDAELSKIRLNGAGTQEGGVDLPLRCEYGSEDIGAWLEAVGTEYVRQGVKEAMVFVCGPPGLADAAKAASKRRAGGLPWHLHVEEFLFLPSMGPCTGKPSKTQPAGKN